MNYLIDLDVQRIGSFKPTRPILQDHHFPSVCILWAVAKYEILTVGKIRDGGIFGLREVC